MTKFGKNELLFERFNKNTWTYSLLIDLTMFGVYQQL